jgi:hypothetical protein
MERKMRGQPLKGENRNGFPTMKKRGQPLKREKWKNVIQIVQNSIFKG